MIGFRGVTINKGCPPRLYSWVHILYTAYTNDFSIVFLAKNMENLQIECEEAASFQTYKIIILHNKQYKIEDIRFPINDHIMVNTHNSIRFLGIHTNEQLYWPNHCQQLI